MAHSKIILHLHLELASAILGANETGRKTKSLLFAAITELRRHKTVSPVCRIKEKYGGVNYHTTGTYNLHVWPFRGVDSLEVFENRAPM